MGTRPVTGQESDSTGLSSLPLNTASETESQDTDSGNDTVGSGGDRRGVKWERNKRKV